MTIPHAIATAYAMAVPFNFVWFTHILFTGEKPMAFTPMSVITVAVMAMGWPVLYGAALCVGVWRATRKLWGEE